MEIVKKYWIVIIVTFGLCIFIKPALCPLILGTLLSYLGLCSVVFLKNISKRGIDWTGNIIEYESDSEGYKTPVIEFTTLKGETVKKKPTIYATTDLSKIRTYKDLINHSVPILYDPDDPQKFILKNEGGFNYFISVIFILGGLFFVGLSICWLSGYIKM